jgi:hypothetical protein
MCLPIAAIALTGILTALVMACPFSTGSETNSYEIKIEAPTNGRVSADRLTAEEGETVTLSILPGDNYKLASILVTGESGFHPEIENNGNTCTFIMPEEDVTVTAAFALSSLQKNSITLNTMVNGTFDSLPADAQYAALSVNLIARPDPGYKYHPGSLKVKGKYTKTEIAITQAGGSAIEWSFEMPAEEVEVDAGFIDENTVLYDINTAQTVNGFIECGQTNAVAGDTVIVTLMPKDGCRYRADSLSITPNVKDLMQISETIDGGRKWSFTMPKNAVHITAAFEEIPRYTITSMSNEYGMIGVDPSGRVIAGTRVNITLIIRDPVNYRYVNESISLITSDSRIKLTPEPIDNLSWSFIMPEEAVTVNAGIEEIPYVSITTQHTENGKIVIGGAATDGSNAYRAREGAAITVTVIPNSGYKLADTAPIITPTGAVPIARLNNQLVWTFNMAEQDLELGARFIELGPLEIYKGGARKGVTVGELSDDKKFYNGSIETAAEMTGHNGNHRVIKVTHALNTNGNTAQHSFGLFSDTEIELGTVAALSFWAKANKQLNIRYVGFGDADPDKRVVYTGENFNQSIQITTEWKRYIVPVPSPMNGEKTTRAFLFNANISNGNFVCIDDIEFIKSGVTISEITIPTIRDSSFYGTTDANKLLKGAPIKIVYACNDGAIATLQAAASSHTLKYNLAHWLMPFIEVNGNVFFNNGIISPREKGKTTALTLSVNIAGKKSNPMTVNITDGILLDDFEDRSGTIPANPVAATGYIWHNSASGSIITREYITTVSNEICSGLAAGNWRPNANANKPRGGRNFEGKDASTHTTLVFRIRVTEGTAANTNYQKNTVFTFELKNDGTLANKTNGNFFAQQFTYNTDGWQEVKMKLSDFAYTGAATDDMPALDLGAITGYAFSVLDNQGTALRISLDDIAIIN